MESNGVVFDVRLLCDVESLQLTVGRSCLTKLTGKYIDMKEVANLRNCGLEEGTKQFVAAQGFKDTAMLGAITKQIVKKFYEYLPIVKPLLFAYSLAQQLVSSGIKVMAYSNYSSDINQSLKHHIPQDIAIIEESELAKAIKKLGKRCTLITSEDFVKIVADCPGTLFFT
eukprot:TRINITY_DN22727_c0_g1_i1.p1 TRINITY_DN22727_c0_g1~~TRINITY_DN22727_c0_g1_i1.p1  ORF type:complete len:170 (+),score=27.15 TRINITY_DN22727_c0_g1_i1:122-631(+)